MGPPGPLGSIHVKEPPYFESVAVDVGFVTGTGATVADVVDTDVDGIGATVDGDVEDDACVFGGVVAGAGVVFGALQPITNDIVSSNTDKAIKTNRFFIK
jgi:hypothetical protein